MLKQIPDIKLSRMETIRLLCFHKYLGWRLHNEHIQRKIAIYKKDILDTIQDQFPCTPTAPP